MHKHNKLAIKSIGNITIALFYNLSVIKPIIIPPEKEAISNIDAIKEL